ncbi:MAG: SUMF1/EgtB/PvdO family nonheme iron enzyme, partial [Nitrospinota bacterium]
AWTGFEGGGHKTHPVDRSYNTHESPYGAVDMAGNVLEWVNDRYDKSHYKRAPDRNPKGADAGTLRVLRGGSWYSGYAWNFRAANRDRYFPIGSDDDWGFRCAKASG